VAPWLPGLADRVIDSRVTRWDEGLPHVPVGHATAIQRYRDRLPAASPVILAGDYLGFAWTDAAAFNGRWAAERLLSAEELAHSDQLT
jgi:oxygen-dependent protoporphyrinogen oxidase